MEAELNVKHALCFTVWTRILDTLSHAYLPTIHHNHHGRTSPISRSSKQKGYPVVQAENTTEHTY